uniref:Uncharacterized protein n=1 Tax=Zea mays TaxID=4577 RepID=C0P7V3_MAIZE|nr:unknown [Zea mays]
MLADRWPKAQHLRQPTTSSPNLVILQQPLHVRYHLPDAVERGEPVRPRRQQRRLGGVDDPHATHHLRRAQPPEEAA